MTHHRFFGLHPVAGKPSPPEASQRTAGGGCLKARPRPFYSSHERAVFWSVYSIFGALVLVVTFVFSLDLFSIP